MGLKDVFGSRLDDLESKFDAAEEAAEFEPIPRGEYTAIATKGELIESSQKNTPGFQLEFTIDKGEYKGRSKGVEGRGIRAGARGRGQGTSSRARA